jgi:hypothetical protein
MPDWFPDIPDTPAAPATAAPAQPAQKDWFPDVPEKPYESPYKGRVANLQSLPGNLAQDIGQFGTGLATLGALPVARVYEMIPRLDGSQKNPFFLEPSDWQQLGQAGKDIVDYYVNEYGKPYVEANKAKSFPEMAGAEAKNLGEHFLKAPLSTALDILPEKALAEPLEKAAGPALKAMPKFRFPVSPRWLEDPHIPEWVKHLQTKNEVEKLVEGKLEQAEQGMKDKMFSAKRTMDEAFNSVPKEIRPYLLAAGEITDPDIYKAIGQHPAVKNLLGHVENFNQEMERILNIPEPINMRTRYGGMLMQRLEAVRQNKLARLAQEYRSASPLRQEGIRAEIKDLKPLRFEDLKQPKYMKMLEKLKAGWEKEHAPPIYAAIANAFGVKGALNKLKNAPLAQKGNMSALAKQMSQEGLESAFEANPENMPGWLSKGRQEARIMKTRPALTPLGKAVTQRVLTIRGAEASHNIKDLTLMRLFESYRLQGILSYLNKLKEMSTKEHPGWVKVNLADEFKKLVANTPAAMMPKLEGKAEIWLPKKTANALLESLHGNSGNAILQNKVLKGIIGLTNLRNQVAYALNPVFAAKLAIQTGAIELFSWKTPKDALYDIAGHIIAAHPEAKDILPNAYILSHDVHMPIELLMSGMSFEKAWAMAKDIGGNMSYGPQDQMRRAMAVSFLLKNASGAGLPIRNLIKSALDVSTTLKLIEEQTYNVNLTKQLQAHMKKYLGDYSNLASSQDWRQAAKLLFSVPAWLAHTYQSVKALPLDHPIKTALLSQLGRIAQRELQPESEPDAFKKMGLIPIKDKQGKTKYVGGLDLVVFHGGLEMIETVTNMIFGPNERLDIPSGKAPALATIEEATSKVDQRTNKPFVEENPDLKHPKRIRLRGTRLHRTTLTNKWVNEEGEEVKQTSPHIGLLFLENEFPNIMKPVQYAAARKDGKFYTPSRFTFPGHPARKTFYGEPIEESNEQAALNLLGIPVK